MTEGITKNPTFTLLAGLEALLFVAAGPVTLQQLADALEVKTSEIEFGLQQLENFMQEHGLRIQRHGGRVQFTTAPELSGAVEKFLGLDAFARLSRAALETMAIIAYRQPITRPGIDAIRGVNSDGVLKSLLSKGLVQEVGRAEGPGRPILFGVTPDFLQHFGISKLDDLPPFETLEQGETGSNNGRLLKD
jgi:segregation and condensation protein B